MIAEQHVAGEIRAQTWRRVWVARSRDQMTCAPGRVSEAIHRLKDPLTWDHGCLRCTTKVGRGTAECGRLVYMIAGGLVTPRGEPLVMLTEVTTADMRTMRDARMDYEAALQFLGISFPS